MSDPVVVTELGFCFEGVSAGHEPAEHQLQLTRLNSVYSIGPNPLEEGRNLV